MITARILLAGGCLAAAAAFTPVSAAPLPHAGFAPTFDDTLIEQVRHRRHWRHYRYGWYGPPPVYRPYGYYRRPYYARPYYHRRPGFGIYFGTPGFYGGW